MAEDAWKNRLRSAGNMHSEHLVFRDSSIRVEPTLQLHIFLSIFTIFGAGALWFAFRDRQHIIWILACVGGFFVLLAELMRWSMLLGKRAFFDLDARVFYPEGKGSATLPIGISEILQLELVSSTVTGSKGSHYMAYALLAVTRAGQRYAISVSGVEKAIRQEAQKLAQTLLLSLNEWSLDSQDSLAGTLDASQQSEAQSLAQQMNGQNQSPQMRQVRPARPMSPAAKKVGVLPGILFGLVFSCIGIWFGCFFVIFPCIKVWQSRTWRTAPAVVISSRLGTSRGSKGGTTYRIEIEYQYQVDGKTWYGKQYDFFSSMHTNVGVKGMREAVNKNPIGAKIECLYNPAQPSESVISSDIPGRVFFFALFAFIFSLPGILCFSVFLKSSSKEETPKEMTP